MKLFVVAVVALGAIISLETVLAEEDASQKVSGERSGMWSEAFCLYHDHAEHIVHALELHCLQVSPSYSRQ